MSTDPLRIIGIDHVVLRCAQLRATLDFYCEVLGCSLERQHETLGLYQLRAGHALIDLVRVGSKLGGESPPDPARANVDHVCRRLARPDWSRVRHHLARHGIAPGTPARRYGAEGFGTSLYIRDPEGNTVELKGPPERAGDVATGTAEDAGASR